MTTHTVCLLHLVFLRIGQFACMNETRWEDSCPAGGTTLQKNLAVARRLIT